jgi:hypothetical protein
VLPFEVLSILLLAALVGAIVLSRPDLGARPDPEAAAVPAGPPRDPVDESAAVVARLERIAARQSDAQARVRQAHADKVAAENRAAAVTVEAEPEDEVDPLRQRAHDIIFGAQQARPKVGEMGPETEATAARDQDVIEGESYLVDDSKMLPGRPALPAPEKQEEQ